MDVEKIPSHWDHKTRNLFVSLIFEVSFLWAIDPHKCIFQVVPLAAADETIDL